jgi:hypothetical protein
VKPPRVDATEAEWQAFVTDALDLGGWKWHHETDSRKSPSGFPDIVAVHPDRGILFAELKAEKGRLRPEQAAWLSVLALSVVPGEGEEPWTGRRRVFVKVWRPSDAEDVLDVTGVSSMVERVA